VSPQRSRSRAGQIPLEKGPDELVPPLEAFCVVGGEEGPREAPSKPKTFESIGSDLFRREPMELEIGDSAGEGFRALPAQLRRRAPEDEEASGAGRPVGQDAEHREEVRQSLDLVDDDQPLEIPQREHRVGEPGQVFGVLQIESCDPALAPIGDLRGQRRLADLTGADDSDDRKPLEEAFDVLDSPSSDDHGSIFP
jgi:hypothetical protein